MSDSQRQRRMLARTQVLMVVVSLVPLGVLIYITAAFVLEPLQQSGRISTFYSLCAILGFTALAVVLGYILVRRDTVRAIEAIAEGERRIDSLHQATGRLAALQNPEAVQSALLEAAAQLCGAERGAIWLPDRDEIYVAVALGMSEERARANSLPIGQGLPGTSASDGLVRLNAELSDTDKSWDTRVLTKTDSSLIVPLVLHGKVIAVLDLRNKKAGERFGAVEQQLAEGLAQQATLFLNNAHFRQANNVFEESMVVLVQAVTEKHLTWAGHVTSVVAMADKLAERLELPAEKRSTLLLAARVHDIGLLQFDDVAMGPPGGHVDHAAQGAEILEQMAFWAEAAATVRFHHEQMDGRGPLGMRGFAIPMTARILALAEYVDTVTHPASPWGTKSLAEVIREVSREDDERFDPKVVAAFVEEFRPAADAAAAEQPIEIEDYEDIFEEPEEAV
ncbi:MAG: HD domain-containing phosphohydrolase [Myxococcota bacterium]|nr:HD domain-containing phosphohydrolase [Myxococcota bacterium]